MPIDARGFQLVPDASQGVANIRDLITQTISNRLQQRALGGDQLAQTNLAGVDPNAANAVGGILRNNQATAMYDAEQAQLKSQRMQEMAGRIARGYQSAQDKGGYLAGAYQQLVQSGETELAQHIKDDLDQYQVNPAQVDQEYSALINMYSQQGTQQKTADQIRREQWEKDINSSDPRIRQAALIDAGLEAKKGVTTPQLKIIGGVPYSIDPVSGMATQVQGGGQILDAATVAGNEQTVNTGKEFGKGQGKEAAENIKLADTWEINKQFLVESIPELQSAFNAGPGSSISKGVQTVLSKAIGNTQGADAQAALNQYAAIFLQGMPFPPGSQSDKELQARAQIVSDQIQDPNISTNTKMQLIGRFVEWQDTKAKGYRKNADRILGNKPQSASPQAQPAPQPTQGAVKFLGFE
jgi:hypothetical protein